MTLDEQKAAFPNADKDPAQAYELGRIDGAVAERERCAKVAKNWEPTDEDPGMVSDGELDLAASIAAAIRNQKG